MRAGLIGAMLAFATSASAESLTGKVVSVADGDTVTVLAGQTPIKVRLHGVDAPEKAQAFGEKAKDFTARLVLGQPVRVEVVGRDKYGRTVGTVQLVSPPRCLNEELVKAGLAWWYRQYAPKDQKLAALEEEARKARRGLWAEARPLAPWAFRHPELVCASDADCVFLPSVCPSCPPCTPTPRPFGNRAALRRIQELQARARCAVPKCPACASPPFSGTLGCVHGRCTLNQPAPAEKPLEPSAPAATATGPLRGNVRSKALHAPGCRDHGCKSCTASFARSDEARRAGYRPHRCVAPFESCVARCVARNQARAVAAEAIEAECRGSCAR